MDCDGHHDVDRKGVRVIYGVLELERGDASLHTSGTEPGFHVGCSREIRDSSTDGDFQRGA